MLSLACDLEQLGAEMLGAADGDGADVELAGLLARRLEEVRQRLERRIRVGREHQVEIADERDRREVLHRIERQRL